MKRFVPFIGLLAMLVSCVEEEKVEEETEDIVPEEDIEEEEPVDTEEDPVETEDGIEGWEDFCDSINGDKPSYDLPSSEDEAPQLIIVPEEGESYGLTKEASSDGWFMLEVPSWMCDIEIYTPDNVQIELEYTPDWGLGAVGESVAECGDTEVVLHSWTFHAWGSYVVHIQAEGETEFWLATRLVEP